MVDISKTGIICGNNQNGSLAETQVKKREEGWVGVKSVYESDNEEDWN